MPSISTLLFYTTLILFTAEIHAHVNLPSECGHTHFKHTPKLLDVDEEFIIPNSRLLQIQPTQYPNIRITFDFSNLINGTADFKNYVQNQLVPAVQDYLQGAIALKQPLISPLQLSTSMKTICDFTTPKALFTGVSTDLYVIVTSVEDVSPYVASAGACYVSSNTKRPIIAQMAFNTLGTKSGQNDPFTHEKNIYLTVHEMFHALGFSGSSYKNFIDASGKTLQNHIKTVLINGVNTTVIDVEPLTTKLRNFYGCSSVPGAIMEDDGGSGTEGSHFERRYFIYEVMTSGVMDGLRISQFSLALLEGSGWYSPNYTYAEPFFSGQGEGCNFIYSNCSASNPTFAEYCPSSTSTRGCATAGRGGGFCSSDPRSDGCSYYMASVDYNCLNPNASSNARLPDKEIFGFNAGSVCFEGNLTKSKSSSQSTFCFNYNCTGSGLSTTVDVFVGTTKVTCQKEGPVAVSGLNGNLNCPDPLTFCSTAGKRYCPRGCMGRGDCVNNKCQCKVGFSGVDCGLINQ